MGFVLVAMIASIVDYNFERRQSFTPWAAFKILAVGGVAVTAVQVAVCVFFRSRSLARNRLAVADENILGAGQAEFAGGPVMLPLFLSAAVGLTFAVRGALVDGDLFLVLHDAYCFGCRADVFYWSVLETVDSNNRRSRRVFDRDHTGSD